MTWVWRTLTLTLMICLILKRRQMSIKILRITQLCPLRILLTTMSGRLAQKLSLIRNIQGVWDDILVTYSKRVQKESPWKLPPPSSSKSRLAQLPNKSRRAKCFGKLMIDLLFYTDKLKDLNYRKIIPHFYLALCRTKLSLVNLKKLNVFSSG